VSLQSPLGRVTGLGAAHDGVGHWWAQRVTALALVPLGLWLTFALLSLPDLSYETAAAFVASPRNAVLLLILVPVLCYHGYLGVRVVLEDYVHGRTTHFTLLLLISFAFVVAGTAGMFSVLRLALGPGS
jgi:succinate dehydrogenase / fumarate reductase membrane anchor subunit